MIDNVIDVELVGFRKSFNKKREQYCYIHRLPTAPVEIYSNADASQPNMPEILLVQKDEAWKTRCTGNTTIVTSGHVVKAKKLTTAEVSEVIRGVFSVTPWVDSAEVVRFNGGDFVLFTGMTNGSKEGSFVLYRTKFGWYRSNSSIVTGKFSVLKVC